MKRWEDILKEEPSRDLTSRIEDKVFEEMSGAHGSRRWWLSLAASFSLAVAAVVTGYRITHEGDTSEPGDSTLVELAEDDLDLETLEDLDVIEILEEIEEWENV